MEFEFNKKEAPKAPKIDKTLRANKNRPVEPAHSFVVVEEIIEEDSRIIDPFKKETDRRWKLAAVGSDWYPSGNQQVPFGFKVGDEVHVMPGAPAARAGMEPERAVVQMNYIIAKVLGN